MYNFINCILCCSMLSLFLLLCAPWAAKIFLIGKAYLLWSLCILYLHACIITVCSGFADFLKRNLYTKLNKSEGQRKSTDVYRDHSKGC